MLFNREKSSNEKEQSIKEPTEQKNEKVYLDFSIFEEEEKEIEQHSTGKEVQEKNYTSKEERQVLKIDNSVHELESDSKKNQKLIEPESTHKKKQLKVQQEPMKDVPQELILSEEEKAKRDKFSKMVDEVIEFFTINKAKELMNVNRGLKTKEELLEEVRDYLHNIKSIHDETIVNDIIDKFKKYVWGYYLLDDLLHDDSISDIKILGPDNVRIKRNGKRMDSGIHFKNRDDLVNFIRFVCVKNQRNLSDINAIQKFTDKETNPMSILRFNICSEFINSVNYPYLHVRTIPKVKRSIERLMADGLFTLEQWNYLSSAIKQKIGMTFTGKGASGKTTLMNKILDEIPHNCSGLVIQEAEELFSDTHPDLMFQHVQLSSGEGKIQYDLKDLGTNGLLIDLDYYIIGEIKGGEALYYLNACYTGHVPMASVHGTSSTEAINKLVDYAKYASDYTKTDLLRMFRSLGLVIFMKDYSIQEISEIVGFDEEKEDLIYNMVFKGREKINDSKLVEGF